MISKKILITWVNAGVFLTFTSVCIYSTLHILDNQSSPLIRANGLSKQSKQTESELTQEDIKKWSIFGDIEHQTPIDQAEFDTLQTTQLDISLTGVFYNLESGKASAIITLDNDQLLIRNGESPLTNTSIAAIRKDHIIIKNEESLEALYIKDRSDTKPPPRWSEENTKDSSTTPKSSNHGKKIETASDELKRYGIRDGDTMLSINGHPLGSESDSALAFQSLQQNNQKGTITVERDGEKISIELR